MNIVLFTKQFPYGYAETYLENELGVLSEEFDKIYIFPFDEYQFDDQNKREVPGNVSVIKSTEGNQKPLSFFQKIQREFACRSILLSEIAAGREAKKHRLRKKEILASLRHSYSSALLLNELVDSSEMVFYNYWLHRGVIISQLYNQIWKKRVPICSRAHSLDLYHSDWLRIESDKEEKFLAFETFKIKACDKVYSISNHGFNHFYHTFPDCTDKFDLARLGTKSSANFENIQSSHESPNDDIYTLVTCSGLTENKRMTLMPEILKNITKVNVHWIHFGPGSKENIELIEDKLERYGKKDNFTFKGRVANSEIHQFYQSNRVDFFCNISYLEGIPVTLMEASSYGIPLIGTKTIGNPEIVNDKNGILIPVDFDSAELAREIEKTLINKELHQQMRKKSLEMHQENYDAEKNYKKFAQNLKELHHEIN